MYSTTHTALACNTRTHTRTRACKPGQRESHVRMPATLSFPLQSNSRFAAVKFVFSLCARFQLVYDIFVLYKLNECIGQHAHGDKREEVELTVYTTTYLC